MKIVKVICFVIVVILLAVSIGGYIFLKTIDLNAYIPRITDEVKKATGRDLSIGNADLKISFARGVLLEVSGVKLSDAPGFPDQPFLSVDLIRMGVDLKPLIFERKLQIADVTVGAPKIMIIRNKDGLINAAVMSPATAAQAAPSAPGSTGTAQTAALPALMVKAITVSNATVTYRDEMVAPRIDLVVDRLDLKVEGLSLTEPFTYNMQAAVLSSERNVELSGKARIELSSLSAIISELRLKVELDKVSLAKLNEGLPMLAAAGLKNALKGRFDLTVQEAKVGATGLASLKAEAALNGGRLETSLVPFPVEDVTLTARMDTKDLVIQAFSARLSGGTVTAAGVVHSFLSSPAIDITGNASGVELKNVCEAYKLPVTVTGKAKADFKVSLAGKTPEEMTSSLRAQVSGGLGEGTIEGANLLKSTLSSIPMLPALWGSIQEDLPPETRADLEKGTTLIERCDVAVKLEGMTATIEKADLVTRDLSAKARGTVKVPDTLDIKVDTFVHKALAGVLVKKVSDLSALLDDQGALYIPVTASGPMLKPKVGPDVDYLSKKLIVNRGKEELIKVLDKNPEVKGILNTLLGGPQPDASAQQVSSSATPDQAQPVKPEPDAASQAVDVLFNSLFKKK